jgi:hypothetical protein
MVEFRSENPTRLRPLDALAPKKMRKMRWGQRFDDPVRLRNGREIGSLIQARDFMVELSPEERRRPVWECAADLIFDAAHQQHSAAVDDARKQFVKSLRSSDLI